MDEFPSGKLERGKIFAKTGLKVGSNYAKYFVRKAISGEDAARKQQLNQNNAQDVFKEFTKLRGTALKLAQSMSMDTGILPDEFIDVMSNAQYRVPPINRALVRAIIKQELGKYPEMLFSKFGAEAIAAASIGQVHRAELKDGRAVAVKIQYPNVRETIKSDLTIAKALFKRIVRSEMTDAYFEEIYGKLLEETDYLNEGLQIEQFAQLSLHPQIVTPRLIPEMTTRRVLAMTFLDGVHLDEFLKRRMTKPAITSGRFFGNFSTNKFCTAAPCCMRISIPATSFSAMTARWASSISAVLNRSRAIFWKNCC